MAAVWYRARAELRRRWRATLALTLLVGLAGAVVLTVVAGSRRSASAYDRFREASRSADLLLVVDPDPARLEQVERLPQVETLARIAVFSVRPEGTDQAPGLDFVAGASPDGVFLNAVDRLRVVEGREPDPGRSDELGVSEGMAARFNLAVGQEVTFESRTPEQEDAVQSGEQAPEFNGPRVTGRVVGLLRSPLDLSDQVSDTAYFTPAFYQAYQGRMGAFEGLIRVRLRGGEADLPAFSDGARRIYHDQPELGIQPAGDEVNRVDDAIAVVAIGLALFAVAAGLVGMVAVAQALGRHLSQSAADETVLASVGMTRPQRIAAASLALAPTVAGGALLAAVVAVLASPLMPVGIARRAEPNPGLSIDAPVLGLGAVALVVVTAAMVVASAWRSTQTAAVAGGAALSGRSGPSAVARAMVTTGLPPPATTGARMAFEPGRGRSAVPVRSGLAGTTLGVAGLVAAVIFAASLTALADTPSRYGWNWDVRVPNPGAGEDVLVERHGAELTADPAVADLAAVRITQAELGGDVVPVLGFLALKGSVVPTVTDGRAAQSPDEVVLGSRTLSRLGTGVGGTVEVSGPDGPVRLRVVGQGPIPYLENDNVGEGAMLTRQGVDRLATDEVASDLVLNWAPDIDQGAARRQLEQRVGPVVVRQPSAAVTNLERIETLPRVLAIFLALLAVLAVGHTLVITVRRRRRDLAVLKVLGFRRLQVSATVAWQASLLVLVALAVGMPLGVAAGRWAWALVANGIGVVTRPEVPVLALAVTVPAALLVTNLMAAFPAWAAARTQPALVLRTE
ncbi:MAG: FtsX-like permease family protein [Actinomycetota bacterium]|nr:FtsX-like permease family protein [Actinomycetota bacterium]MDQ3680955.1 FtsX-like permease family protein [Actinomycetota bacterium]